MAPPSARQLASPMRLKFSSPFSPSISVVQPPSPKGMGGICEQPATANSKATTSERRVMDSSWRKVYFLAAAAVDAGGDGERLPVPGRGQVVLEHRFEGLEYAEMVMPAFRI